MELFLGFVFSLVVLALAYFSRRWRSFFAALWLCIFCILGDVLGIFLVLSPQGQDFLIALQTSGSQSPAHLHQFWFFSALVYLAFSAWACARALMYRLGQGMPEWIVTWFPRALGLAPLLAVFFVFAFNLHNHRFTYISLLLTLLYVAFIAVRRPVMRRIAGTEQAMSFHGSQVSLGMKVWLGLSLALSALLFVLFLIDPVAYPQAFGASSIALMAVTSWVLFGSIVLMLWPRAYGWPSLAWLPVVLAVAASYSNENIRVRELAVDANVPVRGAAARQGDIASDFDGWLATRKRDAAKPFPVFIVTAEGGGVRAAYWAASVLTRLQSENPEFAQHVYGISGVSGGSLGGATFAALLQAQQRGALSQPCINPDTDQPPAQLYDCAQAFLAHDFMSPALAYLLYEDLAQRFLFIPIKHWSRATALEQAWERGWQDAAKSGTFGDAFAKLWEGDKNRAIPSLFLNGTIVETGSRIITSNVPITNDDFPDAIGTFDETLLNAENKASFSERMRLSTAVHMSARFTYVSPPGRLMDSTGQPWGHVIDGGYFENSGGGTAFDLYISLRRAIESGAARNPARYRNLVPVFVVITNSPSSFARNIVEGQHPQAVEWLTDLLAPPLGLLSTREARGRYSLAEMRQGERVRSQYCVVNFGLQKADREGHDPILGWFLARDSRAEMRGQLDGLHAQTDRVKRLLTSGRCA